MLKTIILDDEPLPVELLSAYAKQVPQLEVVATFNNPLEAVAYIQNHPVDLIFLDIEMPHLNGLDLLRNLEKKPMAVFTTAYPEFAVDGFELNAIDYLLKPFDLGRFKKAVEKAELYLQFTNSDKKTGPGQFIFVKSEYRAVKINLQDIIYIEGMDSYVKIYAGGRPVLSLLTMKAMMDMLPQDQFLRVHRSYIIPIAKVKSIRNKVIKVEDKEIPIGGTYEEVVEKVLKG